MTKNIPSQPDLKMAQSLSLDTFVSTSARLPDPARLDGRLPHQCRDPIISFGPLNGQARVQLGNTQSSSTVLGELTPPLPERPNEGRLFFNVELGSIANPSVFEYGRPTSESTTLCKYIEKVLRGSKAIDTESLCVLGGKTVWSVRVDTHALCADGSLYDACALSSLCSLLNFKHESVAICGDTATVFRDSARDPIPISVHHLPISTSFVVFQASEGLRWFVDPTDDEERALGSVMSLTVNQHGELCAIHKPGGVPIDIGVLSECLQIATQRAKMITHRIQSGLDSLHGFGSLRDTKSK